ncbi:hypothetical protein KKI19_03340 [Patescibacteria group bacterium]|nr:hypothetical protein [Patescibacteria group bacterium]
MLPKLLTKRKIALIILILALFLPLFAQPIRAFSSGPNSTYPFQFYNAVFETEEMNLQSFVYETMRATIMSIVTLIVGDPSEYEGQEDCYFEKISCWYKCKIEDPKSDCPQCEEDCPEPIGMGSPSNGAVFQLANFISLIYANPPASGVEYLADVGRRLNLVQPAYAQEAVGWGKFQYALPIWKAFRDVTYVFFVLILVFMGFAIMFRVKINPQTVITIQSALPRVILALILITFSYAIVGFLIDLMYVLINLTIFLFSNIQLGFPDWLETLIKGPLPDQPTTSDFTLFYTMLIVGIAPLALILLIILILGVVGILGLASSVTIIGPGIGAIALIIAVVLVILLLIALLRVCWALLKAYINVLIALIFAPFQLLVGALPGSNAVGSWFRNLIANLAVWPAVFVMTFLAGFITLSGLAGVTETGPTGNLILLPIVGLGILLMTPKVSDMIKAFFAGKPFEYGTAIGEAMGPITGVAGYGLGLAQEAGRTYVTERVYPRLGLGRGGGQPTDQELPPSSAPRERSA